MAPVQHNQLPAHIKRNNQTRAKARNRLEPETRPVMYGKQVPMFSDFDESYLKEMERNKHKTHLKKSSKRMATSDASITRHMDASNAIGKCKTPGASLTSCSKAHEKPRTPPTSSKINVHQFHAIGLLSSQHHVEKTKILTQNGLTESAATTYEASLHASNSTSKADQNHSNHPYRGAAKLKEVSYSDTESEEEKYIGHPFYIDGDEPGTQQSRVVRSSRAPVSNREEDGDEYYTPECVLSPSLFPNVAPYLNFASHTKKGPNVPAALHNVLKWKLSPVLPNVMKRIILNTGFRTVRYSTDWMGIWEAHMKNFGFRTIRSHQKYNHMPGSTLIGRKDTMWRSIYKNIKKFGWKEFGFMQKTYIMPYDQDALRKVWPKHEARQTKWIVKPPAGARGTGIRIVNKWGQFNEDRHLVVQKYIERPLLINHSKFDMRLYVVVTSINPLRIYMYKDGLARFASVKYSAGANSLDERCMHLTNYSINKHSQYYSKNENFNSCQGHKWTLQSLWSCLENRGVDTKRLWATLRDLVIRSLISGEPTLARPYNRNVNNRYNCFELLGFDVLLDENVVPWLLEVNVSPSLNSDLPLDRHVKGPLVQALLNTALYQVPPRLSEEKQADIIRELKIYCTSLCYDKRLFSTGRTPEEAIKQREFCGSSIEFREEYLDSILQKLQPADLRCLILAEDELNRCSPLERIFPTSKTHKYLEFMANPRYFNRLLDAWENKYAHRRAQGLALLRRLCNKKQHLLGCDMAVDKEPIMTAAEINQHHTDVAPDCLTKESSTSVISRVAPHSTDIVDFSTSSNDEAVNA